jgi:hypothetical protein
VVAGAVELLQFLPALLVCVLVQSLVWVAFEDSELIIHLQFVFIVVVAGQQYLCLFRCESVELVEPRVRVLPEVLELSVVVFYCSRCLDLFQQ